MKTIEIETIHESLVNGQRRQMVEQIDEYGLYDFWVDYGDYLTNLYADFVPRWTNYQDAVISYFRIKNR